MRKLLAAGTAMALGAGLVIGAGKMTIDQLEKNKSMKLKLEFFKPWKGLSWAKFELVETSPGKTQVSWYQAPPAPGR